MNLTAERVRELLSYDPATGQFHWKQRMSQRVHAGARAGSVSKRGYRSIKVEGKMRRACRLAWLMVHGEWPRHEIDHVNGDRGDDRIENLRDVTHQVNTQNLKGAKATNRSTGLLGVSKGRRGRPQALIRINGETVSLGHFDSAELAHQAYVQAKRAVHPGCTL